MRGEGVLFLIVMAFIAGLTAIACALGNVFDGYSCEARWAPRETEYSMLGGCRVKTLDGFIPEENLRGIE